MENAVNGLSNHNKSDIINKILYISDSKKDAVFDFSKTSTIKSSEIKSILKSSIELHNSGFRVMFKNLKKQIRTQLIIHELDFFH